jgi:hypothetical protein
MAALIDVMVSDGRRISTASLSTSGASSLVSVPFLTSFLAYPHDKPSRLRVVFCARRGFRTIANFAPICGGVAPVHQSAAKSSLTAGLLNLLKIALSLT